ncbi:MAG: radical SAM protein [Proteobacteria bacterium]|nr:radical SAM protein [Pseudomonadota bacterium]
MNARFLEIEITGRCLYKCRHCYGDFPKKGELGLEKVREIIGQAKGLFDCLIFSGGEPFLHPALPAMVQEAAHDFLVFITTSGYPISDEQLQQIKNKSILVFGMDGIGDIHDTYRGFHGAFKNLIQTMDRSRDVPKEIIVTLWKGVIPEIDEIIKLGAQYNAIVHFNGLIPVGRAKNNPDILPEPEELEQIYRKLYQLKMAGGSVVTDLHKVTEKDTEAGIDLFCRGRFNITPLGDVRPCEFHTAVLGNIYTGSLQDIINRANMQYIIKSREEGFKKDIRLDLKNPFDYHTTICHTLACNL